MIKDMIQDMKMDKNTYLKIYKVLCHETDEYWVYNGYIKVYGLKPNSTILESFYLRVPFNKALEIENYCHYSPTLDPYEIELTKDILIE